MTVLAGVRPDAVPSESSRPVSMVERMTLILDAFDGSSSRLLLEDIASRTGLPRSTAHRILEQLVQLNWVEHARAGYRLGRRVQVLGARENTRGDLRAAAAPYIQQLAVKTDLVVHLAVLDGDEVEYLDKVGWHRHTSVASRVGGRSPVASTALGKAILSWMPPEQVDALLPEGVPATRTAPARELLQLHTELAAVRRAGGLAFESEECVAGVACVGAAIRGVDGPVGAISLVGTPQAPLRRLAPLVRDVAHRIAKDLDARLR